MEFLRGKTGKSSLPRNFVTELEIDVQCKTPAFRFSRSMVDCIYLWISSTVHDPRPAVGLPTEFSRISFPTLAKYSRPWGTGDIVLQRGPSPQYFFPIQRKPVRQRWLVPVRERGSFSRYSPLSHKHSIPKSSDSQEPLHIVHPFWMEISKDVDVTYVSILCKKILDQGEGVKALGFILATPGQSLLASVSLTVPKGVMVHEGVCTHQSCVHATPLRLINLGRTGVSVIPIESSRYLVSSIQLFPIFDVQYLSGPMSWITHANIFSPFWKKWQVVGTQEVQNSFSRLPSPIYTDAD